MWLRFYILFGCLFILFDNCCIAQPKSIIDSLEKELLMAHPDTVFVQINNKLCWENRLVDFAKAMDYGTTALNKGRQINYQAGILKSLSFLGVTCINSGNHPLALQYFLEALDLAKSTNNLVEVAYTYNNLGKLYYNERNPQLYKQYFANALEAARKTTNKEVLAYSLRNVAFGYEYEKDYKTALQYRLEALRERDTTQQQAYLISSLTLIGACYSELGDFNNAFYYFNRALVISANSSTILDKSDVLNAKAESFLKMKKYDSALHCALESYKIAMDKNAWEWIKISSNILYKIYHGKQDFSKALTYHVIRTTYEDSIINEGRMIKIKQLNLKHDFEQRERERALAEERKDILQEEALKRSQLLAIFILLILIAVLVILYLIYKAHKQQKILNELLAEKNTEIETQKAALEDQAAKLLKQSEQLIELNTIKNKLFSIISHDLRSPFAALSGALPLLESGDFTPEETSIILADIKRMTDNAADMLENLLQWAKSQMNTVKVTPTTLKLSQLAGQNIELYEAIAKQKNITFYNEIAPIQTAFADNNHVLLVFQNLIGNAIKFTKEGGNITISATQQDKDNMVIVAVQDTGVGMAENVCKKIFGSSEIFTTQGTAGEKGTGLGLMLCKEFIEKNNGKIWVESTEGIGTTFYFSLPIK
jgi:two-component system sensor histidine kinase/response regulator